MQQMVRFGQMVASKSEVVAYTANALITELLDRCRRSDGIRNYYDIAVIGYCNDRVESLLADNGFTSIKELSEKIPEATSIAFESMHEDGSRILTHHRQHRWIEPLAEGNTPMYETLHQARNLVEEWCEQPQNQDSFPPIVINITDGEASDCSDSELLDICSQLRAVATDDGQVLLLNIHITSSDTLPSIIFPMADELLSASRHARTLAECSSVMPEAFSDAIHSLKGMGAVPPYYGMGYNATIVELLSIINIGSRSITNMA
jgi:hypothetical protein